MFTSKFGHPWWSTTATDVNKREVLLGSAANNSPLPMETGKHLEVGSELVPSVGKDFMFQKFHVIALKD